MRFKLSPFGGLGTTYDVHLGLIGKRVVDFLLVLITLFARCYGWIATGETDRKSAISLQRGHFDPKFQVEVRPMNALQLCRWQFSNWETLQQTFFKRSAILDGNRQFCGFEPPLRGSEATYDDHLRLIGKRLSVQNQRFHSNRGRLGDA